MAIVHMYQMKVASSIDQVHNSASHKNATLLVERALNAEGLLSEQWIDGIYGTKTIAAYAAWQRALGYRGDEADGKPGLKSLRELGRQHGFKVTDD